MKTLIISIITLFIMTNTTAQNYRKAKEANGLKVGQQAPDFSANDANGKTFQLSEELKNGPVVLIFYRGQWCPICNKHLGTVQKNLEQITKKGARVVAVSPEKPELLETTAEKTGANFTLLFDEGYKIADAWDVTFRPGKATRLMYNTMLGANLKEAHSDDSQRLPIPATYVINTDGKIVWRHFDPDYKKRSTIEDIVAALELLN
ncbi:MAG: peroxiredoxin-like family protein [Mariniphaga sp.]